MRPVLDQVSVTQAIVSSCVSAVPLLAEMQRVHEAAIAAAEAEIEVASSSSSPPPMLALHDAVRDEDELVAHLQAGVREKSLDIYTVVSICPSLYSTARAILCCTIQLIGVPLVILQSIHSEQFEGKGMCAGEGDGGRGDCNQPRRSR